MYSSSINLKITCYTACHLDQFRPYFTLDVKCFISLIHPQSMWAWHRRPSERCIIRTVCCEENHASFWRVWTHFTHKITLFYYLWREHLLVFYWYTVNVMNQVETVDLLLSWSKPAGSQDITKNAKNECIWISGTGVHMF